MLLLENDELIVKYAKGEKQSISILFDKYYSLCLFCSMNILGCKEDAEDAVSSAFVDLWETRQKYNKEICSLKTWLLMFVRRRSIDILRKRHPCFSVDDDRFIEIPIHNTNRLEYRDLLLQIMNSLSSYEKDLFYRRFFYLQSYEEIARHTEKSVDSIKSSLYRIRKYIKKNFYREGKTYE